LTQRMDRNLVMELLYFRPFRTFSESQENTPMTFSCGTGIHNILVVTEFSRFRIMYFLVRKTITSGPARNFHTQWV